MTGLDDYAGIEGTTLVDREGDKIGKIDEIYEDAETGRPEWALVHTGLFGMKRTFVPIRDASRDGDNVRVPVDKAMVKGAPGVEADGRLSQDEERALYEHYGVDWGRHDRDADTGRFGGGGGTQAGGGVGTSEATDPTRGETATGRTGTTADAPSEGAGGTGLRDDDDTTTGRGAGGTGLRDDDDTTTGRGAGGTGLRDDDTTTGRGTGGLTDDDTTTGRGTGGLTGDDTTTGRGTGGDTAMTRSEEELRVGTERREAGRGRLRKYVVTEEVTQTVPVQREELRVEREPITDDNREAAMRGPEITESEHEVVLHEDRPVVDKQVVPKERVRMDADTVEDEHTVTENVRREHVDVDDQGRTD